MVKIFKNLVQTEKNTGMENSENIKEYSQKKKNWIMQKY